MKMGLIGLPGSGRSTVFEALTKGQTSANKKGANLIFTVKVPDPRVDFLSEMYKPKKTTFASVEYLYPASTGKDKDGQDSLWNEVRGCDALIQVVCNFNGNGTGDSGPGRDISKLQQEMVFADYMVVDKRVERIEHENKRGKKIDAQELELLKTSLKLLEKETPLRQDSEIVEEPILKGYGFISAKPLLTLFNNQETDDNLPDIPANGTGAECMMIKGLIESELATMDPDEAREFLAEYSITESAMNRVISRSYQMLGLISFFTVGEDEVRAWTIKRDTPALDAAEVIHSDIKRGFIRAEVVAYQDLLEAGDFQAAKKAGKVRLEGKQYKVQDGDIISFRFNV